MVGKTQKQEALLNELLEGCSDPKDILGEIHGKGRRDHARACLPGGGATIQS
jgi:hypothetical protein